MGEDISINEVILSDPALVIIISHAKPAQPKEAGDPMANEHDLQYQENEGEE